MSLPKSTLSPPLSSPSSKNSLRRPPSRPHSIDQVVHTNDTPDEHPSQPVDPSSEGQDEPTHHEPPSPARILSQPFFTLIEDTHISEYYHPTVHYIFSDDDTDIVTEAVLRSLESEQNSPANSKLKGKSKAPHQNLGDPEAEGAYEDGSPTRNQPQLPDPIPGVRDNYIILDIDRTPDAHGDLCPAGTSQEGRGQEQTAASSQPDNNNPSLNQQDQPLSSNNLRISSAHSLSPSWQVLDSQLLPAPTFENNASGEKPANGGLMLQIQGTPGLPVGALGRDKERGHQRLEDMMDQFARRLDELKLVIENGERGMRPGAFQGASPLEGLETQTTQDITSRAGADEPHGEEHVPED